MGRGVAGLVSGLLIIGTIVGFTMTLWRNGDEAPQLVVIVPTQLPPTDNPEAWQNFLREGFGGNSTPLPTVPLPTRPFEAPTLPGLQNDNGALPIQPATVGTPSGNNFSEGVTPTTAPQDTDTPTPLQTPTPFGEGGDGFSEGDIPVFTEQSVVLATKVWQPPPLIPPISRDPFGRDHYWLSRPVDSDATNYGLFYYPYGSDGPNSESPWRVHHGIDMPNPIGETVRAAGSGKVIWAADTLIENIEDVPSFQSSPAYGNVVMIEHDFGYRGEPIYTLYAHLSSVLVRQGQFIDSGDVIGLVGNTGRVSGSHVHFEVRVGGDRYADTFNPVLWMVPYVGHGVIAGIVTNQEGDILQDQVITLRRWSTGLVEDTTTSYIFQDTPSDVNPDPVWQENFVFADVPAGRYELVTLIDGERVSKIIDVHEGTTTFVDYRPDEAATPLPTPTPTDTGTPPFITTPLQSAISR